MKVYSKKISNILQAEIYLMTIYKIKNTIEKEQPYYIKCVECQDNFYYLNIIDDDGYFPINYTYDDELIQLMNLKRKDYYDISLKYGNFNANECKTLYSNLKLAKKALDKFIPHLLIYTISNCNSYDFLNLEKEILEFYNIEDEICNIKDYD